MQVRSPIKTTLPNQYQPISPATNQFNQFGGIRASPGGMVQQQPMMRPNTQIQASPSMIRPVQQQYPSQYNPQMNDSMIQSTGQQVERLEQPLQVVDLFKVEQPWKERVEELEKYLKQLKSGQTPPPPQPQKTQQQPQQPQVVTNEKQVVVQDDQKIEELNKELNQAYAQIQQLINTSKKQRIYRERMMILQVNQIDKIKESENCNNSQSIQIDFYQSI